MKRILNPWMLAGLTVHMQLPSPVKHLWGQYGKKSMGIYVGAQTDKVGTQNYASVKNEESRVMCA